jgi:hypothetical protein
MMTCTCVPLQASNAVGSGPQGQVGACSTQDEVPSSPSPPTIESSTEVRSRPRVPAARPTTAASASCCCFSALSRV